MRIALGIEFDGTPYSGWQSQPNGVGVQDRLQRALSSMADEAIHVIAAGRTDAGVHGRLQIVHFDTQAIRPNTAWVRGTNAHLPNSIRVLWALEVAPEFHARFDAYERSYQYLLYNHPVASAIAATKSGWFHLPLDVQAMSQAASFLLGEHDFSAFRASDCQAKTPVRVMKSVSIKQAGAYIVFEFTANAFLYHQVRNMVGALIYVGKGNLTPADFKSLLEARNRTHVPPTFAPHGLYLVGVKYPESYALPETYRPLTLI